MWINLSKCRLIDNDGDNDDGDMANVGDLK